MTSKSFIIAEIKRTAKTNNGTALGLGRFEQETGILRSDLLGIHWARWGDAVAEAGFEPNVLQGPRDEEDLLEHLVLITRHYGHFPIDNEIRLWRKDNPGCPAHSTFFRTFGKKRDRLDRLMRFSEQRGYEDVARICTGELSGITDKQVLKDSDVVGKTERILGYVYLLKSGRFYKIGRTNAPGRRKYELDIQLPEELTEVHLITTDDPIGIEKYWHKRFKDRRKNGEWFELKKDDVAAFKRRKSM